MCSINDSKQGLKLKPVSQKPELAQENRRKKKKKGMWGHVSSTLEVFHSQASYNQLREGKIYKNPEQKEEGLKKT